MVPDRETRTSDPEAVKFYWLQEAKMVIEGAICQRLLFNGIGGVSPQIYHELLLLLVDSQTPVHLPRAHRQHALLNLRAQAVVLTNPRQPTRQ